MGRILATPISVDYIHEPFNPACGIEGFTQSLAYAGPGTPNEDDVRRAVEELTAYRARLTTGHFRRDTAWRGRVKRVVGSRGPFHYRLAKINPRHEAALVKDPVGCLLLRHLVDVHGFDAVALVRHPLGVVQSFERLGADARVSLQALRDQPWFVSAFLDDEDRELLCREWTDPRLATAVFWRLAQGALARQAADTGTPIVRHEDISADPMSEFRALFDRLRLPWSTRVERRISRETAGSSGLADRSGATQQFRRASAEIAAQITASGSAESRRKIWELTGTVAAPWYGPDTFNM